MVRQGEGKVSAARGAKFWKDGGSKGCTTRKGPTEPCALHVRVLSCGTAYNVCSSLLQGVRGVELRTKATLKRAAAGFFEGIFNKLSLIKVRCNELVMYRL